MGSEVHKLEEELAIKTERAGKSRMQKYSVLMSVYQKEKPEYLRMSIASMAAQTAEPDEIVIVEDGPLPQTLHHVLRECRHQYPLLIRTVPLEKNCGLGNALNIGLGQCRNELIARMDTDDISLPDRCEKQLACFARDTNLAVVGTQIREFSGSPENILPSRKVPICQEDILKFARRRSPFNHPTVMYKRSKVLACGGYGPLRRKEDLDLFLTMLYRGYAAQNIDEPLLLYRADAENLKRRKEWDNCREYIEIIYKFYRLGFSSLSDFMYVMLGQTAMCFMPAGITKVLNHIFLRSGRG